MTDRKVGMKRSTADRLVKLVEERIADINGSTEYAYSIDRAVIFGSYVNSDCDTLGDLDIGILFKPIHCDEILQRDAEKTAKHRCPGDADPILKAFWPKEEIVRAIKRRNGYISVHEMPIDNEVIFSKETIEINIVCDNRLLHNLPCSIMYNCEINVINGRSS